MRSEVLNVARSMDEPIDAVSMSSMPGVAWLLSRSDPANDRALIMMKTIFLILPAAMSCLSDTGTSSLVSRR